MEFRPFCLRMVRDKEKLPNMDGKMMSRAEIETRIHDLERWRAASKGGDTSIEMELEIRVLKVVLGQRDGQWLTCGEHAKDLESCAFGTRPQGIEVNLD